MVYIFYFYVVYAKQESENSQTLNQAKNIQDLA